MAPRAAPAGARGGSRSNEETLRCLEIADSSLADGARAQQWACARIATQLWDAVV
ncbi:hypothetical protein [Kitasatospora sp. NPDC050463]|uniref:hypothetical protein n=1 Tax=Kitasatospora sp. NPDC050463 TaxID=3155786 RepID=UPI0033D7B969